MLEGALRIQERRLEANHVGTAGAHLDLAKLAIDRGEWRPADVHVSAAERVFEAPENATHLD